MDELFDSGVPGNSEDVLSAFHVGAKEFISVSGFSHQGGTMKYEIATIDRSTQRSRVKEICSNDLQWEVFQSFCFLRITNHAAHTHSLFLYKSFRQPAPDET
jgi:hypothetical protein